MPIKILTSAVKRMAAVITTLAALLVLVVNAKNLGLDAWLGSRGFSFANAAVTRIVVAPRSDTVYAIGDTVPLAATVTDKRGATVAGATLFWETSDTAVASVDSAGTVVARGPGTAVITASVRDVIATARVTVLQRVVGVAVASDTVLGTYGGDSLLLAAHPVDARGHPVIDRAVRWRTDDERVLRVDSTGRAMALQPGRVTLVASFEEYSDTLTVDVSLAPAGIELVSEDDQVVPAGTVVPDPVVVRVLSRDGRPVPNAAVAFVPRRGGHAEPDTAVTDGDGHAQTAWTLDDRPGRQILIASVARAERTLGVTVEAEPVFENTRVRYRGRQVTGAAGAVLDDPVQVEITDSLGRVLNDLPVTWTAEDDGVVEPLTERTNALGVAMARWTLGPRAGEQRLVVQVGNPQVIPRTVITATALPGPAAALAVHAGNGQRGTAGEPLEGPVVLRVQDALGNPVAGVTLSIAPVQGTVIDSTLVSDSLGLARVRWTLGDTPGPQRLEVRAAGVDSAARVTARAR